jgi:hypothetical protein
LALYNFVRFGDIFETGYHFDSGEGFSHALSHRLLGVDLQPLSRRLLAHAALHCQRCRLCPFMRRHRSEALLIALLSGVLVGMYSLWWMWWGGFAWGPRFLVPLTPLWVLVLAPVMARLEAMVRQNTRQKGRSEMRRAVRFAPNLAISTLQSLNLQSPHPRLVHCCDGRDLLCRASRRGECELRQLRDFAAQPLPDELERPTSVTARRRRSD